MPKKADDHVTKKYLDKKLQSFVSKDLYKIKDEIVGEIKGLREEFNIHQYSHVRINEELEDHEKRITRLQTASVI